MPRKVNLKSLKNLIQYQKRINPELIKNDLIGGLAREGKRLIMLAYASRGWNNRTKNLKDSYVSAVFVDGKLDESTVNFLSRTPEATRSNKGLRGRQEAMFFLEDIGARLKKKGICLVIGAAMPYSYKLEKDGYRVLANIHTDLSELATVGVKGLRYVTKYDLSKENPYLYRIDTKKI